MSLIEQVITYVGATKYEDLPKATVDITKRCILDTLAITIAGSSAEGCTDLARLIKGWGGSKDAGLLVYGKRVPAPHAALLNGSMARAHDLGDVHSSGGHLSETTVPSAFVFADYAKVRKGKAIDGKSFIVANAICSDLVTRLRMAGKQVGLKLQRAEFLGPIAVAAMGAKLYGFDKSKLHDAMGLGYSQCCGNGQAIIDGALAVRLQQGLACQGGVMAVMLAEIGFNGAKDILEGEYGLYPLFMHGQLDPAPLIDGLGRRFEIDKVSVKLYPACLATHGAIDGVLEIARTHDIKADDIAKITISASKFAYALCAQGEQKKTPASSVDAQFSYYYVVACALARGKVFIDDFTDKAIRDPRVLDLARRVEVVVKEPKPDQVGFMSPTDIEIKLKSGAAYSKTVEFVKGHPNNPVSFADVAWKFRQCAPFSVRKLASEDIERIIDSVSRLETLPDVSQVIEPLLRAK